MHTFHSSISAWQRLKNSEISCSQALKLLVDEQGTINLALLDPEVNTRFLRHFSGSSSLPPGIPLLLWHGCYYLGCPDALSPEIIVNLTDRTGNEITIFPISDKSYHLWFESQNLNPKRISSAPLVNPLTSEHEQEDIGEATKLSLSKVDDQVNRIKTLLSGALRNRASDIHLEPMPEGLRVRYRIDGVLRDITTLPTDLSRRVIVALKVMSNMDISENRRPQDGRIEEKYTFGEKAEMRMDMRVSSLPCMHGEKAVIRLLPQKILTQIWKRWDFPSKR